jgi:hypothetical protein
MSEELKCAEDWLKTEPFVGIKVYDPDGWDRSNYEESWAEKITLIEFKKRLMVSTIMFDPTKSSFMEAMNV